LSWFLGVIDTKDVLGLRGSLKDLPDHAGEIPHVDSWNAILAFADDWQFRRVLFPGTLEMVVEDGFTETVQDTC